MRQLIKNKHIKLGFYLHYFICGGDNKVRWDCK